MPKPEFQTEREYKRMRRNGTADFLAPVSAAMTQIIDLTHWRALKIMLIPYIQEQIMQPDYLYKHYIGPPVTICTCTFPLDPNPFLFEQR
jgi:hypothetical protein